MYSPEFKEEACRLVMEKKQSVSQTARDLKVSQNALSLWLKKRGYPSTKLVELPSDTNDPSLLKARVRELESKVRRLEMERDILKKATAYFASQSLCDSPGSTGSSKGSAGASR
jgi:transposase